MNNMRIEIENLGYNYRKSHIQALEGVTAVINPGIHLLLGENGSGKTTLLQIIDGLRFPTQGKCMVDGVDTTERCPAEMARVAYLGTDMVFPAKNIAGMVRTHAPFYPGFSYEMLRTNLEAFNISDRTPLSSLSSGNMRKAQVAYMLALQTDVLLLDEPANAMDIDSRIELQKMILRCMRPGQIIIVSTHTVSDLENLYDGLIMLKGGKMVLNESTSHISAALAFTITNLRPEKALHAELYGGHWHAMLRLEPGMASTEPDYTLLYRAMRSENAGTVAEVLENAVEKETEEDGKE